MSETVFDADPWAWLYEVDSEAEPDYGAFAIVAGMLASGGDPRRCREAIDSQDVPVERIVTDLPADCDADWIWVVPDDTEPADGALAALLRRVLADRQTAVVGALLVEPRRRGAGTLVADWAQTISRNGRMRLLTEPGELYQGQLNATPALGVPAAGMLIRGDVWRFLAGFNTHLPRSHWGLDFGWRANLAGYQVMAEPAAQVVDCQEPGDPADDRAAGLALTAAHARRGRRWLVRAWLIVVTLLMALAYLLGKDPERAGDELGGLRRWLGDAGLRRSIRDQLDSLPVKAATSRITRELRPRRGSGIRRAIEQTAARLVDWVTTFTGHSAGVSIDEMTGDDFAATPSTRHRVPLVVGGAVGLTLAALVASRGSFGSGSLVASQLLAAPQSWLDLLASYLDPVPGSGGAAGAPWVAITGIFSLITAGQPEALVTLVMVLAVPLAWLGAFRLLRQFVVDRRLAAVGALAYALGPALLGGMNVGSFGLAVTAVLLPVLGYSSHRWLAGGQWSWRAAGAVAFWLMLACSLVPAWWAPTLVAAVVMALRARRGRAWAQWALVLAAPLLLLVGPWGLAVLRYPGRLLTGSEPTLAPNALVQPWSLLIGRPLAEAGPPVWLSIVFFAVCWLLALAGAVRRPRLSGPALIGAGACLVVALALTRLVVAVPPGQWVRPQALEWLLLLVAALVLAAVTGLDGITADLQGIDLGLRHLGSLSIVVAGAAALLLATGWWVLDGQVQLTREPVGDVPAFVRNAQLSSTPGRTLALRVSDDTASWSLIEGDFARMGSTERGVAFGGSAQAYDLAASVVNRLMDDSADDQLLPDLVSLGVSHVTLANGDANQRMAINNVPGLDLGTGNAEQFVWPVPNSATATVVSGSQRSITGDGQQIAAGGAGRTLQLAEPADPRWQVVVGGTTLVQRAGDGPGTSFDLATASGELQLELADGVRWWAWLQLVGLVVLGILAAPSVRRRSEAAPRRIAGGEA